MVDSKHFQLKDLGSGVHAAISIDGGWAVSNAGIVDLGDRTLVFDTFAHLEPAGQLKREAERITGRSVDYVVNSHYHRDHRNGNQLFTNAEFLATRKTRETMVKTKASLETGRDVLRKQIADELETFLRTPDHPDRLLWGEYLRAIVDVIPTLDLTLPTITFESGITIHGRSKTAELVSYGGGHTESDSILFLPEDRIAFLGDLLFIGYQPYLGEADPRKLLHALDRAEGLDATTLVPGHGPVGTAKDLAPMREYIESLERTVDEVRTAGGNVEQAMQKPLDRAFQSWKFGLFYQENVESLFKRRTGTA